MSRNLFRSGALRLLVVALLLVGCGSGSVTDAGPTDADSDAKPPDSSPPDGDMPDANPPDSEVPDASPSDAGPSDAGTSDASPSDAGPSDASPSDASPSDAGTSDAGTSDAGPPALVLPPAPPAPDLSRNPTDALGRPVLTEGPRYYLYPRPPDALTALSSCTAMVVRCVDPSRRGYTIDACVAAMPACTTSEPWLEAEPCCPGACAADYDALRSSGTAPIASFRQAFYGTPSCAPGVDALLGVL